MRPREDAARGLRSGALVIYPTESFFAIGVLATDKKAIAQLFQLKQRDSKKPVALIASDIRQVKHFFSVSQKEEALMKQYWPGSVTIVLRPKHTMAAKALGARRIGVRVPTHAGARPRARRAGGPITATSANISGVPPTKSVRVIRRVFPDILVAPGRCGRAMQPSSVVEIVKHKLIVHRLGAVHVLPPAA